MLQKIRAALTSFGRDLKNSRPSAWFCVSLVLTLLAALFSYTFHHFDEQFQVLEFTSLKLGKTPVSAMRWEYPAAMRPWLQPWIYYLAARFWTAVGIESPFFWAFTYRLLSGVLTWLGMVWLYRATAPMLDEGMRGWCLRLMALLWFIPYLSVRTSGETFTTIFLLYGMAIACQYRTRPRASSALLLGVVLSLCALVRFPSGVFSAGIFFWMLFIGRARPMHMVYVLLGTVGPLVLSAFIDRWGYGYWTFPMWNYVHQNLVLGKSIEFGTSPFFAYLYLPSLNPMLPLTLPLTAAALWAFYRWPKSIFTWACVPYLIVHSCLAHKESRFVFPIAMLLPFLVPLAAQVSGEWFRRFPQTRTFKVLLGINLVALCFLTLSTTRKEMALQKRIYDQSPHMAVVTVIGTPHPFQSTGMESYFYRPEHLRLVQPVTTGDTAAFISDWCLDDQPGVLHVVTRGGSAAPSILQLAKCQVYFESLSEYYLRENPWRLEKNPPVWRAYACTASSCSARR